jgi:phosphatidylglycerol---prolipoprotein diacylglyceryl transferase
MTEDMPVNLWLPRYCLISGQPIPTYGLMLYLGAFIFVAFFLWEGRKLALTKFQTLLFLFMILVSGVLMSLVSSFLLYRELNLTFYGASLGMALSGWFYLRKKNISLLDIGDAGTPGGLLAFGIMKLGCLVSGCCYGATAFDAFFHTIYQRPYVLALPKVLQKSPHLENIPLHPTQLWTLFLCLGIFVLSYLILPWSRQKPGRRFGVALCSYGMGRFIIDFFSGLGSLQPLGPLWANQWMSLVIIVVGLTILVRK